MLVNGFSSMISGLFSPLHAIDSIGLVAGKLILNLNLLAQAADTDVLAQMQRAFATFVESGQIWAFFIGIFLGYMFRYMTSY